MHNIVCESFYLIFLLVRIRLLHFPFVGFKRILPSHSHQMLFFCFTFVFRHVLCLLCCVLRFVLLCYSVYYYVCTTKGVPHRAFEHSDDVCTCVQDVYHMSEFQQSVAVITTAYEHASRGRLCSCYRGLYCCCRYRLLYIGDWTDVIRCFSINILFLFPSFGFPNRKSANAHRTRLKTRCYFHCCEINAICNGEMSVCIEKNSSVRGYNIASIHIQIIRCRYICMCVNLINSYLMWLWSAVCTSTVGLWCARDVPTTKNPFFWSARDALQSIEKNWEVSLYSDHPLIQSIRTICPTCCNITMHPNATFMWLFGVHMCGTRVNWNHVNCSIIVITHWLGSSALDLNDLSLIWNFDCKSNRFLYSFCHYPNACIAPWHSLSSTTHLLMFVDFLINFLIKLNSSLELFDLSCNYFIITGMWLESDGFR